ncbi:hypothetical protein Tco_1551241 [Tanacetum coccineum]
MFSVCACSRFQVQPKVSHLNAVKKIFTYLKGHPKDSPFILEAFSDSDYEGASLDRKSPTRGCQFLGSRYCLLLLILLVHNQAPEGEGSATPPEPQPTPSTTQPVFHEPQTEAHIEQILPSPTTYQRKRGGDSVERAITTIASLDTTQDSDNIIRTQTTAMPNVDIP